MGGFKQEEVFVQLTFQLQRSSDNSAFPLLAIGTNQKNITEQRNGKSEMGLKAS